MGLLTAPLGAMRLGVRVMRGATHLATLPARAGVMVTLVTYEELLDVAERAALVEPPDPPAKAIARPERPRRRPAS